MIFADKPINIMLVEDDDGDAKALRRAFQKTTFGHSIRRAVDGIEALGILKGLNGQVKLKSPNVLLIDLNMPRMDGIQLVSAIRRDEELRRSIIFILTTSRSEDDRRAVYGLNVAGYVVKAAGATDFLNLINLLDRYWRTVEFP